MNTQLNVLPRPKFSESERWPYVVITVLFTACKGDALGFFLSACDAGITLTSAPVSTKKRTPLLRSVTKNTDGRLGGDVVALVTLNGCRGSFPRVPMVEHIYGHYFRTYDDTSISAVAAFAISVC